MSCRFTHYNNNKLDKFMFGSRFVPNFIYIILTRNYISSVNFSSSHFIYFYRFFYNNYSLKKNLNHCVNY